MIYSGYFDGASRGNPGEASIGAYLMDDKGKVVFEISQRIGIKTNNEAEYMALIALLEEIRNRGITEVKLHGDSQLVINQVAGNWRINHLHLHKLREQAISLMEGIKVSLEWIPREENSRANKLSYEAFKSKKTKNEDVKEAIEEAKKYINFVYASLSG